MTKAHIKKEFLQKLLDKLFENTKCLDKMKAIQSQSCSDYPFFSRICQENKHIFGDIYISLMSRNEITVGKGNNVQINPAKQVRIHEISRSPARLCPLSKSITNQPTDGPNGPTDGPTD